MCLGFFFVEMVWCRVDEKNKLIWILRQISAARHLLFGIVRFACYVCFAYTDLKLALLLFSHRIILRHFLISLLDLFIMTRCVRHFEPIRIRRNINMVFVWWCDNGWCSLICQSDTLMHFIQFVSSIICWHSQKRFYFAYIFRHRVCVPVGHAHLSMYA